MNTHIRKIDEEEYMRSVYSPEGMIRDMAFRKWMTMPYLRFKHSWEVAIIPPFGGVMARFWVRSKKNQAGLSVYFDAYNMRGSTGRPYWEIYPDDGGVDRFELGEEKSMMKRIAYLLSKPR